MKVEGVQITGADVPVFTAQSSRPFPAWITPQDSFYVTVTFAPDARQSLESVSMATLGVHADGDPFSMTLVGVHLGSNKLVLLRDHFWEPTGDKTPLSLVQPLQLDVSGNRHEVLYTLAPTKISAEVTIDTGQDGPTRQHYKLYEEIRFAFDPTCKIVCKLDIFRHAASDKLQDHTEKYTLAFTSNEKQVAAVPVEIKRKISWSEKSNLAYGFTASTSLFFQAQGGFAFFPDATPSTPIYGWGLLEMGVAPFGFTTAPGGPHRVRFFEVLLGLHYLGQSSAHNLLFSIRSSFVEYCGRSKRAACIAVTGGVSLNDKLVTASGSLPLRIQLVRQLFFVTEPMITGYFGLGRTSPFEKFISSTGFGIQTGLRWEVPIAWFL